MKRAKHPPVVFIEWRDASTASTSWARRRASVRNGISYTAPIAAAGFLLADEKDTVVVALMVNDHADDVSHVVAIPRAMVVRMTQLRRAKGYKAVKPRRDKR